MGRKWWIKMFVSSVICRFFFPRVSFSLKDDSCYCLFREAGVLEFSMFWNLFEQCRISEAFGFVQGLCASLEHRHWCRVFATMFSFTFGKCLSLFFTCFSLHQASVEILAFGHQHHFNFFFLTLNCQSGVDGELRNTCLAWLCQPCYHMNFYH